MKVQFQLTNPHSEETLLVLMLVPRDPKVVEHPIIGFSVIEELLNRWDKGMPNSDATRKVSRLYSVEMKTARSVLKLMQTQTPSLEVGTGQTDKRGLRLAAGQITTICEDGSDW